MLSAPRARLIAATSIVAATVALSLQIGAPANAATPAISVLPTNVTVAPGHSTSEQQDPDVYMVIDTSNVSVANAVVTIDTTDLPTGATLSMPDFNGDWQCATAANLVTCTDPELLVASQSSFSSIIYLGSLFFTITAVANAPFGEGSIHAVVSGDGVTSGSATISINVAQPVTFGDSKSDKINLAPGAHHSVDPTITNTGTATIHGIDAEIDADNGFNSITQASNCLYDTSGSGSGYCHFPYDLAPGVTYELSSPMDYQISADHEAPFLGEIGYSWFTPADGGGPVASYVAGTGPAIGLKVKSSGIAAAPVSANTPQTLLDYSGNPGLQTEVTVTGNHSPTFIALGANVQAAPLGSTAVSVGVEDTGPAAASLSRSGDPLVLVSVTIPTGTLATAVPQDAYCLPYVNGQLDYDKVDVPGYPKYLCSVHKNLAVHGQYLLDFTLQLKSAASTYTGTVDVYDGGDEPDAQRSLLSTAEIVINTTASSSSPSVPPTASSAPGTPSSSPSGVATAPVSGSPMTGGTTPIPAPTATTAEASSGLPTTGNQSGTYVAIGGVLFALGIVLLLVARQRRRANNAI